MAATVLRTLGGMVPPIATILQLMTHPAMPWSEPHYRQRLDQAERLFGARYQPGRSPRASDQVELFSTRESNLACARLDVQVQ